VETVTIKSSKGTIELWLNAMQSYMELRQAIIEKLEKNKSFYSGTAHPFVIYGKQFSEAQKREIRNLLYSDYAIKTVTFVDDMMPEPQKEPEAALEPGPAPEAGESPMAVPSGEEFQIDHFDTQSIFIMNTVRSGQRIECEGDIVVVGDVNAGAELLAGGNIAVFGKLRGLAHAGSGGRTDVCIAARSLMSRQIRIGSHIAMLPARRVIDSAEVALLDEEKITIHAID